MTPRALPSVLTVPERGRRALAVLGGALAVAAASQVALPVPGTPVPVSLAPLAVVLVGGLAGARTGAAALATYLALGALGLPVFAPEGLPGAARLLGPTGGYLLAYPVAAAVAGAAVARGAPWPRAVLAPALGIVTIYAGGVAQLLLLTGSVAQAAALGAAPFVLADLAKVGAAALVLRRLLPATRAPR